MFIGYWVLDTHYGTTCTLIFDSEIYYDVGYSACKINNK